MKIKYWDKSDKADIRVISDERDIKVGYFNNCVIEGVSDHYPLPLIKSGGELLLPIIEMFMSLGRGTIYESDMEWDCVNPGANKIEKTPVFYFVYNCANYFHWIYDTVPYLYSYFEEKKINSDLKLLVNVPEGSDDLYSFVYETDADTNSEASFEYDMELPLVVDITPKKEVITKKTEHSNMSYDYSETTQDEPIVYTY